jgi:hypothetical protein
MCLQIAFFGVQNVLQRRKLETKLKNNSGGKLRGKMRYGTVSCGDIIKRVEKSIICSLEVVGEITARAVYSGHASLRLFGPVGLG